MRVHHVEFGDVRRKRLLQRGRPVEPAQLAGTKIPDLDAVDHRPVHRAPPASRADRRRSSCKRARRARVRPTHGKGRAPTRSFRRSGLPGDTTTPRGAASHAVIGGDLARPRQAIGRPPRDQRVTHQHQFQHRSHAGDQHHDGKAVDDRVGTVLVDFPEARSQSGPAGRAASRRRPQRSSRSSDTIRR